MHVRIQDLKWGMVWGCLYVAVLATADELSPQDLAVIEEARQKVATTGQSAVDCDPKLDASLPLCTHLTDNVCEQLWNSKRPGHLKLKSGEIHIGDSARSGMSEVNRMNLQALVESLPRLPADLRKRGASVLTALKSELSREQDNEDWFRRVGRIMDQWEYVISDVAEERTHRKHPELKKIKKQDLSSEQERAYRMGRIDLRNEILKAKYERTQNWKRVEKVFAEVRRDLLEVIRGMPLSEAVKEKIHRQVAGIELSLPFGDPRTMSAEPECASTEVNAFYSRSVNKFTVCAGWFNGYQLESNLYQVIAHEIAHAIDPNSLTDLAFENSSLGTALRKLSEKNTPYSCDEWARLKKELFVAPSEIKEQPHVYAKLLDCMKSLEDMAPFDSKELKKIAERSARASIADLADWHTFTRLAQPTLQKKGKQVHNEFYLRPDRMLREWNVFHSGSYLMAPGAFVQELSCSEDFASSSQERKDKAFGEAIEATRHLKQVSLEHKFQFCGRECPELVRDKIARDVSENFADWMAAQALPLKLAREKSVQTRREIAATAMVAFCSAPGVAANAPSFAELEKRHSFEEHPENRMRRISVFTPEVARAVGCRVDADIEKGFGKCRL